MQTSLSKSFSFSLVVATCLLSLSSLLRNLAGSWPLFGKNFSKMVSGSSCDLNRASREPPRRVLRHYYSGAGLASSRRRMSGRCGRGRVVPLPCGGWLNVRVRRLAVPGLWRTRPPESGPRLRALSRCVAGMSYGALAEEQLLGYLRVGLDLGQQPQHLQLTGVSFSSAGCRRCRSRATLAGTWWARSWFGPTWRVGKALSPPGGGV